MKNLLAHVTALFLTIIPTTVANGQGVAKLGILFVVDGSGDDTSIADNMPPILHMRGVPLAVHSIRWCRHGLPAKDHRDHAAHLDHAGRLASKIAWYRATYPNEKIHVIGHSAGTHVVLAAMHSVPPGSVDRIVLTGPTVSQLHDLRPALRASRGGIDVFFSSEDQVAQLAQEFVGNADRLPGRSAGETGFVIPPPTEPDAHLYRNLRQYRWTPDWRAFGHRGGHLDFPTARFLDSAVLPTMLSIQPR